MDVKGNQHNRKSGNFKYDTSNIKLIDQYFSQERKAIKTKQWLTKDICQT